MIEILKHNPHYSLEFQKIKDFLDLKAKVLHVGSTSIEDLYAKPIIDIDIIYKKESERVFIEKVLNSKGYKSLGDLGIKERYAFLANDYIKDNFYSHHLYLVKENSLALKNHLLIQKALRNSKQLRNEYSKLKLSLVNSISVDEYCKNKTTFISNILKSELSEKEVQDIVKENLA